MKFIHCLIDYQKNQLRLYTICLDVGHFGTFIFKAYALFSLVGDFASLCNRKHEIMGF